MSSFLNEFDQIERNTIKIYSQINRLGVGLFSLLTLGAGALSFIQNRPDLENFQNPDWLLSPAIVGLLAIIGSTIIIQKSRSCVSEVFKTTVACRQAVTRSLQESDQYRQESLNMAYTELRNLPPDERAQLLRN